MTCRCENKHYVSRDTHTRTHNLWVHEGLSWTQHGVRERLLKVTESASAWLSVLSAGISNTHPHTHTTPPFRSSSRCSPVEKWQSRASRPWAPYSVIRQQNSAAPQPACLDSSPALTSSPFLFTFSTLTPSSHMCNVRIHRVMWGLLMRGMEQSLHRNYKVRDANDASFYLFVFFLEANEEYCGIRFIVTTGISSLFHHFCLDISFWVKLL